MTGWEEWLSFFVTGVRETAEGATAKARRLSNLFVNDLDRIHSAGRGAGSAAGVHSAFRERPLLTIVTGLPVPTVTRAVALLQTLGIVRETTGRKRGRIFSYDACLHVLSEGTEPL